MAIADIQDAMGVMPLPGNMAWKDFGDGLRLAEYGNAKDPDLITGKHMAMIESDGTFWAVAFPGDISREEAMALISENVKRFENARMGRHTKMERAA